MSPSSPPGADGSARPSKNAPTVSRGLGFGLFAVLAFAYRGLIPPFASAPHENAEFPVVVFVLFFALLMRRHGVRPMSDKGDSPAIAALLLLSCSVILLWAHYQAAADLLVPSLGLALLGSGWFLAGSNGLHSLIPAVSILPFAMPIPGVLRNQIVDTLQVASAWLASNFLSLLRVPHFRADEYLGVGDAGFRVVEECSGLASIGALSLAAVFYVGLFRSPPLHAALLIAVTPAIGLLANAVRVLWLTLGDPSSAQEEHSVQGLAVIAFGALALGVLDRLLGRLPRLKAKARPARGRRLRFQYLPRQRVLLLCAVFATLGLATAVIPPRAGGPTDAAKRVARIAAALDEIESVVVETDFEFLDTTGFDATLHRRYRVDRHPVTLFVGVDDRSDRLVSGRSPKTVLPGPRWHVVDQEVLTVTSSSDAKALEIENGARRRLVHHWTAGFDSFASETLRSLLGLEPRRNAPRPGFVVRLSTPLRIGINDPEQADERLRSIGEKLEAGLSVP